MKVLIVMAGFFPGEKYGGPPISINNFCSLLNENQVYIITRNHDLGNKEEYKNIEKGWNDRKNCYVKYLSDDEYNKKNFKDIIIQIKPDLIYLQGLFQKCTFSVLQIAKKSKIKVLLAPRGELCKNAFKKRYKKIPYLLMLRLLNLFKNVHFQSTSPEETESIKKILKIKEDKIKFLTNIPSLPNEEFKRKEKITGEAKFVFISRIHHKKNLIKAIQYFKNIKGKIIYDIYGPIEEKLYWENCKKEIALLPPNVIVNYRGILSHDLIHYTFSQYDCFLFPTFSENYGHVIAEALSVGTPVIISNTTPWKNLQKYNAGWDIALNDDEGFIKAINAIVNSDLKKYNIGSINYFFEMTNISKIKKEYTIALKEIVGEYNDEKN